MFKPSKETIKKLKAKPKTKMIAVRLDAALLERFQDKRAKDGIGFKDFFEACILEYLKK